MATSHRHTVLLCAVTLLITLAGTVQAGEESDVYTEAKRRIFAAWDRVEEIAGRFRAETFVSASGDTIPYRFLVPDDYDPEQRYPLVVCLHGAAGRATDNVKSIGGCTPAQVLSEPEMRERYPSFLLVPQVPPGTSWGTSINEETTANRIRRGRPVGDGLDRTAITLVEEIAARWPVDRDRIYVTGQSMGGGGSWHLAIIRPDLFAAALPMAGIVSTDYADSLVSVPVWAFHGEIDDRVPASSTRDMVEAVNAAGGTARFTGFAGVGHGCWPLVFDDPAVLEWLFAQRKNAE